MKNDLVPRNVVERIIKSPRTKEQMLLVLNSLPSQKPISNILEDIYTEIEDEYEDCVIGKLDDDEMYPCFRRVGSIDGVLDILDKYIDKYIDKYKTESEEA